MEGPAKLKLQIFRIQLGRMAVLHLSLLNHAGLVAQAVLTVYLLLLKIPLTDRSEYSGLILRGL